MNSKSMHIDDKSESNSFRFVLVALITFIVFYSISLFSVQSYQMYYESREYPMWLHVKSLINGKSDVKQKLVVVGDSRAKAGYEPVLSDDNTLNLAVGGSTPIEGYYILKTFLRNNPVPDNLVLSYSPLHLAHSMFFWERTVKYDFLPDNELDEIVGELKQHNDPGIGKENLIWKYTYLTSMYISSVVEGVKKKRWIINDKVKTNLISSKGHAYFGTRHGVSSLNGEVKLAHDFNSSELINYYFIKLIELAKSKSMNVSWYTMPFNEASCKKVSPELVKHFNKYIQLIAAKTEMKIIKNIHCMDNKYFGDGSHVYMGSELTTKDILLAIE